MNTREEQLPQAHKLFGPAANNVSGDDERPRDLLRKNKSGVYSYICYDAKNRSPVAIAGNFIAWAVECGNEETKKKKQVLFKAFSVLDLTLLQDGQTATFIGIKTR
uniref:Uncharacterized protein n=1 Tax=Bracon brevicornis TaxID=1563983 RepID=A0A6V7JKZ5_9HYME